MTREGSVSVVPLFAPLLLLTFFFVWPSSTPDRLELQHIALARAIVDHGSFRVNDVQPNLPAPITTVTVEGDSFSTEAPGLGWLSVPWVGVAKLVAWMRGSELKYSGLLWWLRLVLVQLPAVAFGLWMFFALERRQVLQRAGRFAVLVMASTWPVLLGSQVLWAEGVAAMWWVVALTVLSETDDWPTPARFSVAGVLVGIAVTTSYVLWPLVLPTAVYALSRARQPRWVMAFFVPVAFGFALVFGYHSITYGNAFDWPGSSTLLQWSFSRGFSLWSDAHYGLMWLAPVWVLAMLGFAVMLARGELGIALVSLSSVLWFAGSLTGDEAQAPFGLVRAAMPIAVMLVWPLARAAEALSGLFGGGVILGTVGAYSIAVAGLAAPYAQFFSRGVANPLRDIAWFVWRDGVVPSSFGQMLGFSADRVLWPFWGVLLLVALYVAAAGDSTDEGATWRRNLGVIALGLLGLWFRLAAIPQKPNESAFEAAVKVERQLGGDNRFSLRAASSSVADKKLAEGQAATAIGKQQHALDLYRSYLLSRPAQ